jgi:hypothetical protein
MPQASIRFNLQMISEFNYKTMPTAQQQHGQVRREGAKLEEDKALHCQDCCWEEGDLREPWDNKTGQEGGAILSKGCITALLSESSPEVDTYPSQQLISMGEKAGRRRSLHTDQRIFRVFTEVSD